jgi:hypothetical protein
MGQEHDDYGEPGQVPPPAWTTERIVTMLFWVVFVTLILVILMMLFAVARK